VEYLDTEGAAPVPLGRFLEWWLETVHVVAPVAIVAEEELVVVFGLSAEGAALTLHTLPRVFLHTDHHVGSELQTGGVS